MEKTVEKLLLTSAEAAEMLNISPRTLFSLRGEIVPVKIGASVRFRPEDLAAWVERKSKNAAKPTATVVTKSK